MPKRYALPTFSVLAYIMITKNGQKEFMSLVAPSLGIPEEWHYQRGVTPLTEWYWPLTCCSLYLASVCFIV